MKNNQIIMLVLVFVLSGVCGWFLEGVILGDHSMTHEVEIETPVEEPVEVKSTVPVIDVANTVLEVAKNGKYNLTVSAAVESGDPLSYVLYPDKTCQEADAATVNDGVFKDIPGISGQTYYLRVQNTNTSEFSDIVPVEGFVKVIRYEKITEAELEELFNRYKSWSKAPAAMTSKMEKSALKNLQVVVVNKVPNEEYIPQSLREICQNVSAGIWKKVDVVGEPSYDDQCKLRKLKIEVLR